MLGKAAIDIDGMSIAISEDIYTVNTAITTGTMDQTVFGYVDEVTGQSRDDVRTRSGVPRS